MGAFICAYFACRRLPAACCCSRPRAFSGAGLLPPTSAALAVVCVFAYVARGGWRGALAFVLGGHGPAAVQFAYNYACFGSPLRFGYMYEVRHESSDPGVVDRRAPAGFRTGWADGLRDSGLFVFSPFCCTRCGAGADGARQALAGGVALVCWGAALLYLWRTPPTFCGRGVCASACGTRGDAALLVCGLAAAWGTLRPYPRLGFLVLVGWSVLVMFAAVCATAELPMKLMTGTRGPYDGADAAEPWGHGLAHLRPMRGYRSAPRWRPRGCSGGSRGLAVARHH